MASQNGTRGPCHVLCTLVLRCKAWRKTEEPQRMCRNRGCSRRHLRVMMRKRESDPGCKKAWKAMADQAFPHRKHHMIRSSITPQAGSTFEKVLCSIQALRREFIVTERSKQFAHNDVGLLRCRPLTHVT